jgi:hypothetical protein
MMNPTRMELARLVREVAVRRCNDDGKLTHHCTECAIALVTTFTRAGFSDSQIVRGLWKESQVRHFWVKSVGEYWDLTATQFDPDLSPVLVSPIGDPNYSNVCPLPDPESYREIERTREQRLGFEIADEVERILRDSPHDPSGASTGTGTDPQIRDD